MLSLRLLSFAAAAAALTLALAPAAGAGAAASKHRRAASARYSLVVSAAVAIDWTEQREGDVGCHRSVVDYSGFERWNVRTRSPATVTIVRLDDGDVRLVHDEHQRERPGRDEGVEVGGRWERRARGMWRLHPQSDSASCRGAVYQEGLPDQRGCGLLLPQQKANLMLGFGRAHMAFSRPANLPRRRPFGTCLVWSPTQLGNMPEFHGELAQAQVSARRLLRTRVGASVVLRGRLDLPPASLTPGTQTRASYRWEATLTRVKDARPA